MMSLGTLLVKHGWITKQQLGLAISKQREIGGRLGTCLLEMGAVAEDLLNRSLAEQQGVPSATADDLADIPDKVSRLLPAPIAIRYRAVPFRATHNDVDIAMLEVDNLWLQDELSFIVGRRLNVYITNEARIIEALARYYKAPCSERFVKLLVQLNRALRQQRTEQTHPESRLMAIVPEDEGATEAAPPVRYDTLSPEVESPAPEVESPAAEQSPVPIRQTVQPRDLTIPVSETELESLEAAPASTDETNQAEAPVYYYSRDVGSEKTMDLNEAEVALEATSDVQEIGRILLTLLAKEFTRVGLLQATPSMARGWLATGPGLDRDLLEQYRVTFDQPSIFLNLREGGSFFLGALPEMPAHLDLVACWHKDLSDECAIFPVRVRDRIVALVYGDCGPLGLSDLHLDRIREICGSAARAFERCILEQKRRRESEFLGDQTTG